MQLNGGRDLYASTCQLLPPGVDGYSPHCLSSRPNLAEAKRLVEGSGTKGATVVLNFGAAYAEQSPFPRYLLSLFRELGYRTRIHVVPVAQFGHERADPRYRWRVASTGWFADWPTASTFFSGFTCASFHPNASNGNFSEFCDHSLDAQIARAQSLQVTNPQSAGRSGHGPHSAVNLASARVGNYVYSPWLSGASLDLLWVR